ncbi:unnamed protein product [Durusdinium trenchii]|uniref:Uncharacterized protein n=1 Tax=Durusdinium trenchii TaxID=1381693 RepID=A0ABP0NL16_9DINO
MLRRVVCDEAASVPPAAVISAICVLHLGGELPRRRAQLALYLQLAATLWSLSFAMLLLRLCSHWQNVTCQEASVGNIGLGMA